MPLFQCSKCNCVENTAISRYWRRKEGSPPLCSECDSEIGKWHGVFPKTSAKGYLLGSDGFLYAKEYDESGQLDWRKKHQGFSIVGVVE